MPRVLTPIAFSQSRRDMLPAAFVTAAILLAGVFFLAARWPFRREAVLKDLQDASLSKVDIGAFHGACFPRPGCVHEHVTFQHNPKAGTTPLITVERLRIEGSFPGLFIKHVRRIRAEGMRVLIPPRDEEERFKTPKRSTFVIDDLIADGAILEVASREPDK